MSITYSKSKRAIFEEKLKDSQNKFEQELQEYRQRQRTLKAETRELKTRVEIQDLQNKMKVARQREAEKLQEAKHRSRYIQALRGENPPPYVPPIEEIEELKIYKYKNSELLKIKQSTCHLQTVPEEVEVDIENFENEQRPSPSEEKNSLETNTQVPTIEPTPEEVKTPRNKSQFLSKFQAISQIDKQLRSIEERELLLRISIEELELKSLNHRKSAKVHILPTSPAATNGTTESNTTQHSIKSASKYPPPRPNNRRITLSAAHKSPLQQKKRHPFLGKPVISRSIEVPRLFRRPRNIVKVSPNVDTLSLFQEEES